MEREGGRRPIKKRRQVRSGDKKGQGRGAGGARQELGAKHTREGGRREAKGGQVTGVHGAGCKLAFEPM